MAEAAARRQSDHNVLKSKEEEEEDALRDVRVVVLAANSTG